jgi:hypothetical protein
MVGEKKIITLVMGKVMLHIFWLVLVVRVGIPSVKESGGSTLWGKIRAKIFFWFVCGSFVIAVQGAKGNKNTARVCWEVSMKYFRLESESSEETSIDENDLQVRLRRIWYSQLSLSKCNKLNCIYMFLETVKSVMEFDVELIRHF